MGTKEATDFRKIRLMALMYNLNAKGITEKEVSEVIRQLISIIKEYPNKGFKIGKTDDPERRENEHKNEGSSIFKIVFGNPSLEIVDDMERFLIRYFDTKEDTEENLANQKDGGGGRRSDKNMYYNYVIIKL